MDWDHYKFFSAAAELGTVRGAAQALGVNPSTVTRRLEQFEQQLGVTLFVRTSRGLVLTVDGEAVAAEVEAVADRLRGIHSQLLAKDDRLAGVVRLQLADALGFSFLYREFDTFDAQYPDVHIEFLPSYESYDMARREVDLVLTATEKPPLDMIGRPVGAYAYAVYASPELVQEDGLREGTRWLSARLPDTTAEAVSAFRRDVLPDLVDGHRFPNTLSLYAAVRDGLGVAALPCALADGDPGLLRLPIASPREIASIWLLMHPDLRNVRRVRVLVEHLSAVFERQETLLLGRQKRR